LAQGLCRKVKFDPGDIFLGYLPGDKTFIKIKWLGKIWQNNREGIKIAKIPFSFSNRIPLPPFGKGGLGGFQWIVFKGVDANA